MTFYANREKFERFSIKIGVIFSKIPLTPNQWTIFSLVPAIIAAYFLIKELFLFAAFFFILSAFIDIVDGSVARVTGRTSLLGAYLDTVIDRYMEGIIIFGLLFASLPNLFVPAYAWIFLYFFGAMMATYVKAAAKEKGFVDKEIKGGILERAERMILLFLGIVAATFNPLYLVCVIILIAVLSNVTALQRIWIAKKVSQTLRETA